MPPWRGGPGLAVFETWEFDHVDSRLASTQPRGYRCQLSRQSRIVLPQVSNGARPGPPAQSRERQLVRAVMKDTGGWFIGTKSRVSNPARPGAPGGKEVAPFEVFDHIDV